jgi:hypothetical protein
MRVLLTEPEGHGQLSFSPEALEVWAEKGKDDKEDVPPKLSLQGGDV